MQWQIELIYDILQELAQKRNIMPHAQITRFNHICSRIATLVDGEHG